jgi:hypothetical protein
MLTPGNQDRVAVASMSTGQRDSRGFSGRLGRSLGYYRFLLRAVILLVGIAGAYSLGYWRNQPARVRGTTTTKAREFVGFEPARIELGTRLWDTVVPFELTFVNQSGAPITIERAEASCDCMVVEADSLAGRPVGPGEVLPLAATIDTEKHPGAYVRTVTLEGESGQRWVAVVEIDVVGTWSLSADRLDFGEFLLGTPGVEYLEQSLTFSSDTDDLVGQPECDAPWVECFVAPRDDVASEILVRIPVERLLPGVSTTEILLQTTSDVRPDVAVHVRVNAVPALVLRPPNVFLVGDEARRVGVFDHDGGTVELVRVESSDESVSVRVIRPNEIEIQNTTGQRLTEATIVSVEDAQGRRVELRVSVF